MKVFIITLFISFSTLAVAKAQQADTSKHPSDTTSVKNAADGSSYDRAIVIMEKTEATGTSAEYAWLRKNFPGYKTNGQSLTYHSKKPYDILHITLDDGTKKDFYFDISNFFGKF